MKYTRYYVEFADVYGTSVKGVYVYAYSEQQVRDMFYDYELVNIIPEAD